MKLFPKRKPFEKGFFPVGDGHELYYEWYGNKKGKPVLFVHGGPGAGCSDKAYRHFDPKKFRILCVDQRGAGKSKPFASTKYNTTKSLVEDFRKILDAFNIEKTYLFGGSWGSCLSLCFAIKYPGRVKGMVLRGIYLGSREENEYFLNGGARAHFPDVVERFVSMVPARYRNKPSKYYVRMMRSKNPKTVEKYCREWARYELSLLKLEPEPVKFKDKTYISLAQLEAHYLMNDCFLPKNFILKNAKKIAHIPCRLVQGRYDMVTQPYVAYVLHKALPKSKLRFVIGGHASSDPGIREAMMEEFKRLAR